jgi:hypothetical protein
VSEREWLEDYLSKVKGRGEILDEAERIIPLLDDAAIEKAFGRELAGRVNGSVKEGLMDYLEELESTRAIRGNLKTALCTIEASAIESEYGVEMAQDTQAIEAAGR